jgi:post-segregation antitoxin (ccd killing protein)
MVRRMPRLQVYLPDDLYREVKARHIKASELLQQAVRAEVRRQQLVEGADRYLAELIAEVGEPSAEDEAWAEEMLHGIVGRSTGRAE